MSTFGTYEQIKKNLRAFVELTSEQQRTILGTLLFPIVVTKEG